MAYGVSGLTTDQEPNDGTQWYTRRFFLVLDEGQRLGKDLVTILGKYGILLTFLELSLGEKSAYRIDLNVLIAKGAKVEDDKTQDEVLRIIERLHGISPSEALTEHAKLIQTEFAELAADRNK